MQVVYTFVNRKMSSLRAAQLLPRGAAVPGMRFYDCYHGVELPLHPSTKKLSFEIEGGGFGCILTTKNSTGDISSMPALRDAQIRGKIRLLPANLTALLRIMAALTARGLETFSGDWQYALQEMTPITPTPLRPLRNASACELYVPGSLFHFAAAGVEVESAAGSGCDVQFPWEDHPGRIHEHDLHIGAMYVDKFPVTNVRQPAPAQVLCCPLTAWHPLPVCRAGL